MNIQHLRHHQIDKQQWDSTLDKCQNRLIYAQSRYLDIVSPKWEAMVSDGYGYMMPLPVKKKYGFPYLVQPHLTQQLGIFSPHTIEEKVVGEFIKKIPHIRYALHFNSDNFHPYFLPLPNYLLSLAPSFETLQKDFSKNTQRNIRKAQNSGITISENIDFEEFLDFYLPYQKMRIDRNSKQIDIIRNLCHTQFVHLIGAMNQQHRLVAVLAYLQHYERLVYWLPASSEEGKKTSAMFLLINYLIEQYAGTKTELDFEGSRIEGIARFYKGFGGIERPYYFLQKKILSPMNIKKKFRVR